MAFISFPSIVNFHNLRRTVVKNKPIARPLDYRCKVKLHGTNCGIIVLPSGQIMTQSRTQIIGTGNDNVGFSQWVENNIEYWEQLTSEQQITVFGEWCGPNIQKGTAVNMVGQYFFAVFAIQIGVHDSNTWDYKTPLITDPKYIREFLGHIPQVYILDWYEPGDITIDFFNSRSVEEAVQAINSLIAEIEPCDPWVESTFGAKGICEGLVYYPQVANPTRWTFSTLAFKAKGEQHKVINTQPVCSDVPNVDSVQRFIDLVCTEARLEQALVEACGGRAEKRYIGGFLAWVNKDIRKEANLELIESGLTWREVVNLLQVRARNWFNEKMRANT